MTKRRKIGTLNLKAEDDKHSTSIPEDEKKVTRKSSVFNRSLSQLDMSEKIKKDALKTPSSLRKSLVPNQLKSNRKNLDNEVNKLNLDESKTTLKTPAAKFTIGRGNSVNENANNGSGIVMIFFILYAKMPFS